MKKIKPTNSFKIGKPSHRKGVKLSQETKDKISNSKKGIPSPKKGKPIKHFIEWWEKALGRTDGESIHYGWGWKKTRGKILKWNLMGN